MATLQFSDTTNKKGIIQACERLTLLGDGGISGNSQLLKDFTARINGASSRVWSVIFRNHGAWKYDDGNQADLPQGSDTLTAGQSTYALPEEALTVDRIEVKDSAGNYIKLVPITEQELIPSVDEYMENANTPYAYRLLGRTVELFPASSYTLASGFKVYFTRGSVAFDSGDTTETPGFCSEYHEILPILASLDWMYVNKPNSPSIVHLTNQERELMAELGNYYSKRWRDHQPKVRPVNRQRNAF